MTPTSRKLIEQELGSHSEVGASVRATKRGERPREGPGGGKGGQRLKNSPTPGLLHEL